MYVRVHNSFILQFRINFCFWPDAGNFPNLGFEQIKRAEEEEEERKNKNNKHQPVNYGRLL